MKIRILVDEKTVAVDNLPVELPHLDWSPFAGDPTTPWDDVFAVQFDTSSGQGHVEYKEVRTGQVTRPDMRPPDWRIGSREFDANFAFVLPAYHARRDQLDTERALAEERARQAQIEAESADLKRRQDEADAHNARLLNPDAAVPPVVLPDNLMMREDVEAMLLEQEQRLSEKHAKQMSEFAASVADAVKGG